MIIKCQNKTDVIYYNINEKWKNDKCKLIIV